MLSRLLKAIAHNAAFRPWSLILLTVLPTLVLSAGAFFVPIDLSFAGLLDSSKPDIRAYVDMVESAGLGKALPLLLEGPEESMDEALRRVGAVLERSPSVVDYALEPPVEWFERNAPWIVNASTFDAWLRLALDPNDDDARRLLDKEMKTLERRSGLVLPEGVRIVDVTTTIDPLRTELGRWRYPRLERSVEEALRGLGVRADFAGLAAMSAQDQRQTLGVFQRLTPLTLLIVLVFLTRMEPSVPGLALLALPMLMAVGATIGLVGFLLGSLTVLETTFGVLIFGLGIDFAIHLLARRAQEDQSGHPWPVVLERTLTGTGRAVIAGALTTIGAFLIIGLVPDPATRHLGLSGGLGLLMCLGFMLTVLPASWTLRRPSYDGRPGRLAREDGSGSRRARRFLERVPWLRGRRLWGISLFEHASEGSSAGGAGAAKAGAGPHHPRRGISDIVAAHAVKHPKIHIGCAVMLLLLSFSGFPRFTYETDLAKIINRDVPAIRAMERVQALSGVSGDPWLVARDDLPALRALHRAFEQSPRFGRVDSIAAILRADADSRRIRLEEAKADLEAAAAGLGALAALMGIDRVDEAAGGVDGAGLGAMFRRDPSRLARDLLEALEAGPPALEDIPPILRRRLTTADGRFLLIAYPAAHSLDVVEVHRDRLAAQAIDPEATSFGVAMEAMMVDQRSWGGPVLMAIFLFVASILWLEFRSFRLMGLALVPVGLGTLSTIGLLCWFNQPFTVLMTFVVPLIIGLGVDDGIHVMHRMLEPDHPGVAEAAGRVGRAIVLTTATSCVSFSALLFTNHAGMESMAMVMLIGLPICLAASISTLPALAVVLGIRGGAER